MKQINIFELNRKPPANVRKILRQEVNFGCPVDGCGSPYLSWHHFDPPWDFLKHHNPEGMIALCLHHHKEADAGAFTLKQFRKLKQNPFLSEGKSYPQGRFNWKREQLLVAAGDIYALDCFYILTIKDHPIIWLTKDDNGYDLLNLSIYDDNGNLIFSMRDNDWEIYGNLMDLECPPSGTSLKFKDNQNKIWFNLIFDQVTKEMFFNNKKYKKYPNDFKVDIFNEMDNEVLTVCKFTGKFVWPANIEIKNNGLFINKQPRFSTGLFLHTPFVLLFK